MCNQPLKSEQASQGSRLPVHDYQLSTDFGLSLPRIRSTVTNVHHLEVKPRKHPPDIRVIVDADHHLAFAAPHKVDHALVILKWKIQAVAGRLPVRWIHVVERMDTVVALSTFKPAKVFNISAGQTLPRCRQVFLDPQQVNGRAGRCSAERLPRHLAGEGMVLQVKESGSALDVGEGFRTGHLLPLEHLAGTERPLELADEFFKVILHYAIERHQVAVDVIEDLDRRCLGTHEIERGATGKDFNLALVRWE